MDDTTAVDTDPVAETTVTATEQGPAGAAAHDDVVEEELLVEEVSIDGMCGVY